MSKQCPVCFSPISESDSVCPACGFKLSDSTQSFTPVDLDGSPEDTAPSDPVSVTPEDAGAPTFALRVVRGPNIGMVFPLGDEEMSIGRTPESEIFLNDMTVSRGHARIVPTASGYTIIDNNSFNGIWINNENTSSAPLKKDDIIQIGAFCLKVEC